MSVYFCQQDKTAFLCSYNKDYSQKQTMSQLKHAPLKEKLLRRFLMHPILTHYFYSSPQAHTQASGTDFKSLSYCKGYVPLKERSLANRTLSLNTSVSVRKPLSLLQQVNSPHFKNLSTKGDLIFFCQV